MVKSMTPQEGYPHTGEAVLAKTLHLDEDDNIHYNLEILVFKGKDFWDTTSDFNYYVDSNVEAWCRLDFLDTNMKIEGWWG